MTHHQTGLALLESWLCAVAPYIRPTRTSTSHTSASIAFLVATRTSILAKLSSTFDSVFGPHFILACWENISAEDWFVLGSHSLERGEYLAVLNLIPDLIFTLISIPMFRRKQLRHFPPKAPPSASAQPHSDIEQCASYDILPHARLVGCSAVGYERSAQIMLQETRREGAGSFGKGKRRVRFNLPNCESQGYGVE